MTKTPKPKIGRPATGRDPLVSFRAPAHMLVRVKDAARYMKQPVSKVYREALFLGLEHLHGERVERGEYLLPGLRPQHNAEVHEAGHAVAAWLIAERFKDDPGSAVNHIALKQRGAGLVSHKWDQGRPSKWKVASLVAGAVAEAIHGGLPFEDVWAGRKSGPEHCRRKSRRFSVGGS